MYNNNSNNNNPYDELLKQASGKIGVDAQSLFNNASSGQIDSLLSKMKPNDANKLKEVLSNPQLAEQMLNSPQAQMLMKKFMK